MRRLLPLCLLALAPVAAPAQERASKPVPSLGKAPKLDGNLKDFGSGLTLKSPASDGASASFTAKVAWRKDTLFVGVEAKDNAVTDDDTVTVSLFFPGAGPTASGHMWHFGSEGQLTADKEGLAPSFSVTRVEAGAKAKGNTLTVEAAIPARAFPRFPALEPLVFDLCVTYEDRDPEGEPINVSNCAGGSMVGDALKLPDDFRKGLKLKVPETVTTLEPAPRGWLGSDLLRYPAWLEADEPLTSSLLSEMVAPTEAVDPDKVNVEVPASLTLPDGKVLLTVVAGKNPYAVAGQCDAEKELRLIVFLVNGKTAQRTLEWPAATCALGRAQSVAVDEEGTLTIRYSNGATINFAWGGDHFQRTELGNR
ncbi:hypothetical protein P2318_07245 [Myxococcaceae bacterium GXIMD 01537]